VELANIKATTHEHADTETLTRTVHTASYLVNNSSFTDYPALSNEKTMHFKLLVTIWGGKSRKAEQSKDHIG
jgi:hypothetical protein